MRFLGALLIVCEQREIPRHFAQAGLGLPDAHRAATHQGNSPKDAALTEHLSQPGC